MGRLSFFMYSISSLVSLSLSLFLCSRVYLQSSDMVNSFGFYVYNESKERILNPNLNDPYFKTVAMIQMCGPNGRATFFLFTCLTRTVTANRILSLMRQME